MINAGRFWFYRKSVNLPAVGFICAGALPALLVGTWIFAWGYPIWGTFYKSAAMGRVTLWQFFGIPMGVMAVIILVVALVSFYLAGLGEKWAPYDR